MTTRIAWVAALLLALGCSNDQRSKAEPATTGGASGGGVPGVGGAAGMGGASAGVAGVGGAAGAVGGVGGTGGMAGTAGVGGVAGSGGTVCVSRFLDADGDSFGTTPVEVCDGDFAGTADRDGDCDDTNPYTFPGAAEVESATECMTDADEDGWGDIMPADGVVAGQDCRDDVAAAHPGIFETDNGIDNDCDGDPIELGIFDLDLVTRRRPRGDLSFLPPAAHDGIVSIHVPL